MFFCSFFYIMQHPPSLAKIHYLNNKSNSSASLSWHNLLHGSTNAFQPSLVLHDLTILSFPTYTSIIRAKDQIDLDMFSFLTNTVSLTTRFPVTLLHFFLSWSVRKYTLINIVKNILARACIDFQLFWLLMSLCGNLLLLKYLVPLPVRKWFGVNTCKSL